MSKSLLISATFFLIFSTFCCDPGEKVIVTAKADIFSFQNVTDSTYSIDNTKIGMATLEYDGRSVLLTISVNGLTPNHRHAIHIHTGSCEKPGPHWNQGTDASFCREVNQGKIWARPKAGDVDNIRTDEYGNGILIMSSEFWALNTSDDLDLLGRAIIIHEDMEDFAQECFEVHSHTHNNLKIACGTIELL